MEWLTLREAIRLWREIDPHVSAGEMADHFRVSHSRVRELLNAEGLPVTPPARPAPPVPAKIRTVRLVQQPGRPAVT